MTVLIISALADVHARAVMAALATRGIAAELLDLADFPTRLSLSMQYKGSLRRFGLRRAGGGELDFDAVTAVWWRRPQPFRLPAAITDVANQHFAISEATTAFQGLYQSLNAFWINEPGRDAAANHKPYQLTLAQKIGLEIPETLITSDPEAARAFWRDNSGEVIHKQFLALPETWRETRRLREPDETLAPAIAHAPVIFQRHVPAVADLRVIAIGEQLFAAATDVSGSAYPQDVRMNLGARYEQHRLPDPTAQQLHALMQRLGLVYGAIDLRLTPEGHYVFLEINPAGQFLYIENATRQPIADALAAKLGAPP
jgi:glutathione synthase/RimK-type ligase-like ATP-grasp enzyme